MNARQRGSLLLLVMLLLLSLPAACQQSARIVGANARRQQQVDSAGSRSSAGWAVSRYSWRDIAIGVESRVVRCLVVSGPRGATSWAAIGERASLECLAAVGWLAGWRGNRRAVAIFFRDMPAL